jgi:hypothetical protein
MTITTSSSFRIELTVYRDKTDDQVLRLLDDLKDDILRRSGRGHLCKEQQKAVA